jgi:hypothetical protein
MAPRTDFHNAGRDNFTRTHSHFSLLKTIEVAFGLPYLGHAADPTTHTLAPLLAPADR